MFLLLQTQKSGTQITSSSSDSCSFSLVPTVEPFQDHLHPTLFSIIWPSHRVVLFNYGIISLNVKHEQQSSS